MNFIAAAITIMRERTNINKRNPRLLELTWIPVNSILEALGNLIISVRVFYPGVMTGMLTLFNMSRYCMIVPTHCLVQGAQFSDTTR